MFSGIIECQGIVKKIESNGTNLSFFVESPISSTFTIDQSVAHNGVCLTVESTVDNTHTVTAIEETLVKSNLGTLNIGDSVNLERCLTLQSLLDGHLVQGHVDGKGILNSIESKTGSYELTFYYPTSFAHLLVEKGSITINGISLTVFNLTADQFSVAIIPYTWEQTNIHRLVVGDSVNLEFDIIGKYVARWRQIGWNGTTPG